MHPRALYPAQLLAAAIANIEAALRLYPQALTGQPVNVGVRFLETDRA